MRLCVVVMVDRRRCACVLTGFGVGAMILEGLLFGRVFEMELSLRCIDGIAAVTPLAHLLFTFTQRYFIFLNGRVSYTCSRGSFGVAL